MRSLRSFFLLTVALLLFAPTASAQTLCPSGKACFTQADCWDPTGTALPPCWDCVCAIPPTGPPGECVDAPSLQSMKCEIGDSGGVCTMEHCDGNGNCVPLDFPNALDCIPCVDPSDPCKQGTCDGKGGCVTTSVPDGTSCDADGNPCTLEECQNGSCVTSSQPNAPISTPCGNVCLDHCDGQGNCVRFQPDCPVGQPCDGPLCATTKHEICQNELDRFEQYHCLCRGVFIECCDDADCPGATANECIKCIKPIDEPEEVGGNCLCAVGDPCPLGGTCVPETGQCVEPPGGQCGCQ